MVLALCARQWSSLLSCTGPVSFDAREGGLLSLASALGLAVSVKYLHTQSIMAEWSIGPYKQQCCIAEASLQSVRLRAAQPETGCSLVCLPQELCFVYLFWKV